MLALTEIGLTYFKAVTDIGYLVCETVFKNYQHAAQVPAQVLAQVEGTCLGTCTCRYSVSLNFCPPRPVKVWFAVLWFLLPTMWTSLPSLPPSADRPLIVNSSPRSRIIASALSPKSEHHVIEKPGKILMNAYTKLPAYYFILFSRISGKIKHTCFITNDRVKLIRVWTSDIK